MEFVGFQLVFTLSAVIICIIFLMAFGMSNRGQKIMKKGLSKESLSIQPKSKSESNKPLSFIDPHQPNYIKRLSNYG